MDIVEINELTKKIRLALQVEIVSPWDLINTTQRPIMVARVVASTAIAARRNQGSTAVTALQTSRPLSVLSRYARTTVLKRARNQKE